MTSGSGTASKEDSVKFDRLSIFSSIFENILLLVSVFSSTSLPSSCVKKFIQKSWLFNLINLPNTRNEFALRECT